MLGRKARKRAKFTKDNIPLPFYRVTVTDYDGKEILRMGGSTPSSFKCPNCEMEHKILESDEMDMIHFSCRSIDNPMGCGTRTVVEYLRTNEEEE